MNEKELVRWLTNLIILYKKERNWTEDDLVYLGEIIGKLHLLEKIKEELKGE